MRPFIIAFLAAVTLFGSQTADATGYGYYGHRWIGHHGVRLGGYGYRPIGYHYYRPSVSIYSYSAYRHPLIARHRAWGWPNYAWRPIYSVPVIPTYYTSYSTWSYPTYYSTYFPTCYPTTYYQTPIVDSCNDCHDATTISPSSISYPIQAEPKITIDYQQPYAIDQKAGWITVAIGLIDDMTARGALDEAETACQQLMSVRNNLPAELTLRAGLLAMTNGRPDAEVAQYFRLASHNGQLDLQPNLLSSKFQTAMRLNQIDALNPFIQNASKTLVSAKTKDEYFVGIDDNAIKKAKVASPSASNNEFDDARVMLDTLLRVNGQSDKANVIRQALVESTR